MKKLFAVLFFILFLVPSILWAAAGTCTQSVEGNWSGNSLAQKVLTFTCTGGTGAETGTYPATAISTANLAEIQGYYLYKIITNPGAVAPEDNWDFTMVDGHGIDVLGGAGANRHTTASQMTAPMLTTGVYFAQPVLGTWTFTPSGNTTASAIIVVDFVFAR